MYRRLSMLLFLLLASALLNGCATTPQSGTLATTTEQEPADASVAEDAAADARGTMRIAYWLTHNGSESLDPASPVQFPLTSLMLYDRLVGLAEDGTLEPRLATEWTANDDATAWTFTLRDDVTFHDGAMMTSADVAYTFEHILDPATESPAAATLGLIDTIVAEPVGGAHRDMDAIARSLKQELIKALDRLEGLPTDKMLESRYQRLMSYGQFGI